MSLSENVRNMHKMGFVAATMSLMYEHGPVMVTYGEAMNHDWPHLKHLIDVRARNAGYLNTLYMKRKGRIKKVREVKENAT